MVTSINITKSLNKYIYISLFIMRPCEFIYNIRKGLHDGAATCLFTRLGRLAWSQQDFWQPSFCRNYYLWILCFMGGNRVVLFCIAFLVESKSVGILGRMKMDLSPLFFFSMQSIRRNPTLVLPSQQGALRECTPLHG